MKKALSLLITAAMLVAMFAVTVPAAFAAESVNVGTADELIDVVNQINAGSLAADTNITLTADIDLTGKAWKPIKVYNGTFDGNGKTITGITIAFQLQNGTKSIDDGSCNEYIITNDDGPMNQMGIAGFSLLATKAVDATIKDIVFFDSSINVAVDYNKNFQFFYGGVTTWLENGIISNVDMENVDITVDDLASVNQGYLGFAGGIAGIARGNCAITGCDLDENTTLDASSNVKYDVAAFVGRHDGAGKLTVSSCTTAATVTAAPDDNDLSKLMWKNEGFMVGCFAAVAVDRVNADSQGVVTIDVANTGAITGAHVNGNTKVMVGDNQAGDTKVRIKHTAPGGLVGSVVEPHAKTWVNDNGKFYANADGILLMDQQMDEGKIELKLHRDAIRNASQCSGIIFCVTDRDDDCNFWSGEDAINYCLFVNEGGGLILAIDGQYNEEGVYTGQKGWHVFDGSYNVVDNGHDLVAGVTLGVEFDNEGSIKCYVDGKLVYDIVVPENMRLPGTGFGFRMISDADDGTYTSSITAKVKCYHENTGTVGAKEPTVNEEGYTGDKVCSDCGEVLEKGAPIDKLPAPEQTEDEPPKTGDTVLTVSALAVVAAAGAVMIARKRKIEE